jgi:5-methylcytosine-specific restriction endonuclease McrA
MAVSDKERRRLDRCVREAIQEMSQTNHQKPRLLTRDEFREGCLARDGHVCVYCGEKENLSVHHIIERRLFRAKGEEGGYFLDNGATLCDVHHLMAESTEISPVALRRMANIPTVVLPAHLDADQNYDKWGNPILPNGMRLMGELFHEEPVQKVLAKAMMLGYFTNYIKYPRTLHLPWSNASTDDHQLSSAAHFVGQEVVVSEKIDGENSNLYRDRYHARSLEPAVGGDRAKVWEIWERVARDIPEGWRICGENAYAKHSIKYTQLSSYFQVFSIWNERNECLPWDETEEWCQLLGLTTVPILYRGGFDEAKIKALYVPDREPDLMEGYVVRLAGGFPYSAFGMSVAKFVRKNHIQTDKFWRYQVIEPNELAAWDKPSEGAGAEVIKREENVGT